MFVATLELNEPILDDKSLVVVATDEDKLPTLELRLDVVVATLELKFQIELDKLELNVV